MLRINASKKIIALIAALTLIYNSSGYVLVYQQLIHFTKVDIHSSIQKKEIDAEIILLSFKKSDIEKGKVDFKWKDKKEFRYNGGMYDIVEKTETEDSIHLYCFYDHKENLLEANFNKHFEREKKDKNSSRTLIELQLTYLFPIYRDIKPLVKADGNLFPYLVKGYKI